MARADLSLCDHSGGGGHMSLEQDTVKQFAELFAGNYEAIGTEEGGCYRLTGLDPKQSWLFGIRAHLDGHWPPIGVYPMAHMMDPFTEAGPLWKVHWGCIDFDEGEEESWVHAKNVHKALETFGIVGWIERSRSKGYHVWVFADQWVPADLMRTGLLAACQIVDAPTKEINPKQAELKPGQLGNYVRLPYPGALSNAPEVSFTERRVAVNPQGLTVPLQNFVLRAYSSRVGKAGLKLLADAYVKPQAPMRRRDWSGLPRTKDGIAGFAKWVAELPEGNRNMGLYWAARECLDQGIEDLEPLVIAAEEAGLSWMEAARTVESARKG